MILPSYPSGNFIISNFLYSNLWRSLFSPVNVPMGGYYEVYTSLEEFRVFTYANVRKASYRGKININITIIVIIIVIVFKFCVIGGIFLQMFADSLLFDMMLNTAYEDGVDTYQDLIDRNIRLGIIL